MLSEIRQKRTQNTFLYSVKASIFNGFQREATFYYPNWWGDMPMAVYTFLESYDFSGKAIVPFCTHEGSGLSSTENSIAKLCPDAEVLDGLAIRGSVAQNSREEANEAVINWLGEIGFMDRE